MKFKLEINLDSRISERDRLFRIAALITDVAKRLDAQGIAGGTGEGIIWDNNNKIGSFEINN